MIIFISGPMAGIDQYNRDSFLNAEIRLSQQGYTVLSPASIIPLVLPERISHAQYLAICFAMIDACDAVYFLNEWEQSDGARQEMQYATEHGKGIEFERGG